MKFFYLLLALLVYQASYAQVKFGLFAGPQATTAAYKVQGVKQDNSFKYGFQAGGTFKVPFEKKLYFSPAVFYSFKGYKVKYNTSSSLPDLSAIDNNTSFHNVELAFLLQHDFNEQPGHFFIKFGPALDFSLFGNEQFNTNNGGGPVDRKIKFGFGDYGHYLANAILQIGYESPGGIFFYAHYEHGLTNLSNRDGGPAITNRVAGITIGKFLNNKLVLDTKNKE